MSYRIVESRSHGHMAESVEIAAYDSAYSAMRVMQQEMMRRGRAEFRWYLLDPAGAILAAPDDVFEAVVV